MLLDNTTNKRCAEFATRKMIFITRIFRNLGAEREDTRAGSCGGDGRKSQHCLRGSSSNNSDEYGLHCDLRMEVMCTTIPALKAEEQSLTDFRLDPL